MNRFDFMTDVLTIIRMCLPVDCTYKVYVSRGTPQAENCNSIGMYPNNAVDIDPRDCAGPDCESTIQHGFSVMLTRCCIGVDAGKDFDYEVESNEAECFYGDTELIEDCLRCSDFMEIRNDFGLDSIQFVRTDFDQSVRGGCFSVRFDLVARELYCCPVGP